jgi:hypothetical protein
VWNGFSSERVKNVFKNGGRMERGVEQREVMSEFCYFFIYVGTFKILLLVIDTRFILNFKAGFKVINFHDFVLSDIVMNLDK